LVSNPRNTLTQEAVKRPKATRTQRRRLPKVELAVDPKALKKLRLVAVAFSHIEREWFPTEEAYEAEVEVEQRAREVVEAVKRLGVEAKGYPSDRYFFTNLMVDNPDLVINLVDTLRGKDALSTSVPAALELANIPYTGAGMRGLVIGNDRSLFKQLLEANDIPTPKFQMISRRGTKVDPELGLPLIVKLNESGGSVGIDNNAVKETVDEAEKRVNEMIETYHIPVIVEQFIDGKEITVVVFDDGNRRHVFLGEKMFRSKADGKHFFTSLESYSDALAYSYKPVDADLAGKTERFAVKAFTVLHNKDYAKFDVRVGEQDSVPYFTDCNPNTAFGPNQGLPFTELLAMYKVDFATALASLISKHAKKID